MTAMEKNTATACGPRPRAAARRLAAVLACVMMFGATLAGCSSDSNDGAASDGSKKQSDGIGSMMSEHKGQKLASSLSTYIDQVIRNLEDSQQIADADPTGKAKERLLRTMDDVKERGEVTISEYEAAWDGYKQCMLDRGYKEILLIKTANGIYKEAGHRVGTGEQERRYQADMMECGLTNTLGIKDVFEVQTGNPGLLKNNYEGALDCLHREKAIPKSYSMDDFRHDLYEAASPEEQTIDLTSANIAGCMVANNIVIRGDDEPLEELW